MILIHRRDVMCREVVFLEDEGVLSLRRMIVGNRAANPQQNS